jgi:hypothetical protein
MGEQRKKTALFVHMCQNDNQGRQEQQTEHHAGLPPQAFSP